eukprot:8894510-Pyramimonas_sp.AAC.1
MAMAACPAVQTVPAPPSEPVNVATLMDASPQAMAHQCHGVQDARVRRPSGASHEAACQGSKAEDPVLDPRGDGCHADDPI